MCDARWHEPTEAELDALIAEQSRPENLPAWWWRDAAKQEELARLVVRDAGLLRELSRAVQVSRDMRRAKGGRVERKPRHRGAA